MSRAETIAEVEELLELIGPDVYTVREVMQERGIKGTPGYENTCPIYHYLRSHWIPVAWIDEDSVALVCEEWSAKVKLPDYVREFEDAFHAGRFPELIEGAGAEMCATRLTA